MRFFRFWKWREDTPADGFGQSPADDVRFLVRFRTFKKAAIVWRRADAEEDSRYDAHPIIGRFGDSVFAVADHEGCQLVIRDRCWFGWPDPPEFAFFAIKDDGIWAAIDFDAWPSKWTRPSVKPA
jgi:hypothetical protein